MVVKSHVISITVNKKPDYVFQILLNWPSKMCTDAKKGDDGWWSFTTPRGQAKMKFHENDLFRILDHEFVDDEATWDVPMRVVPNDDGSEVIITLFKPASFSDELFSERMKEMEKMMESMKQIIEA